jgi:DNA polymerase-4
MAPRDDQVPVLCRDCLWHAAGGADERCVRCGSTRLLRHPELDALTLAHIDCDAFYATVEKRDNPELADKPVIVGGGRRGVALTCCYIARRYGVHSAMPMFKALALCPQAVVVRPRMDHYAEVSHRVREIFIDATPIVEPVSLDEAYLDLAGTETVHRRHPAGTLGEVARRVEREIGITVSIGLSFNKLLAKLASDMDKPRGFAVIGRDEAEAFLAARPARVLPGVGRVMAAKLEAQGITTVGALQRVSRAELAHRFGAHGAHLAELARGQDDRQVVPDREAKTLSAETTFESDLADADADALRAVLWPLCEKVARRLKNAGLAGRTVVLKLKTASFQILTRRRQVKQLTHLAEDLYAVAGPLLDKEVAQPAQGGVKTRRRFRLIGVGMSDLAPAESDPIRDLFDTAHARRAKIEETIDQVREKFGDESIRLGRGLTSRPRTR